MPMLQEIFQPLRDVERRAVGRTTINRDVLMFFMGQDRVHPCCVRDATNLGACIRLEAYSRTTIYRGIHPLLSRLSIVLRKGGKAVAFTHPAPRSCCIN